MDLSVTFNNLSKTTFSLDVNGYNNAVVVNPSQLPANKLNAMDTQVMAMSNETPVGEGASTFWCCWLDPQTGNRFGVQIIDGGQPFGMGPRPTWQVMADNGPPGSSPSWANSGDDPAQQYQWATSVGYKIVGSPVSTHETLNITVLIQNLPTGT